MGGSLQLFPLFLFFVSLYWGAGGKVSLYFLSFSLLFGSKSAFRLQKRSGGGLIACMVHSIIVARDAHDARCARRCAGAGGRGRDVEKVRNRVKNSLKYFFVSGEKWILKN